MGVHGAELSSQFVGKTMHEVGILGREVVLFADVVCDVVEFLLTILVVVDEFPVAFAYGAVEVDTRASVAPYVGIVPYHATAS